MIELHVGNRITTLHGLDRKILRKLEKSCSYLVAGFYFSPAFKAHRWDGREHLLTFSSKHGYTVPSGLTVQIAKKLKELGRPYKVRNCTELHHEKLPITLQCDLRDYQHEAVSAVMKAPFKGRCILKMPIRSGKTRTAAAIIAKLKRRTLFLVPSTGLLHQTTKALREYLSGVSVGAIGDGVYEPAEVTVATLQTLALWRGAKKKGDRKKRPRDPRYNEIVRGFDVVICDEVHHIRGGGEWHEVMKDLDARYKIGLSATAFPDNETEQERGAIWMLGTCGDICFDLPVSRLVEEGFLMGQNVKIYRVTKPDEYGKKWSLTLRRRCIVENRGRNELIARLAAQYSKQGLRVLIIAKLLDHVHLLQEACEDAGLSVWRVVGKTSQSERESAMEALVERRVDVLLGNVLGEGIDLPEIEVVINAEGGKDDKNTVQRQRNLTIAKGKTQAILVDFLDETNEKFEEHSRQRIAMYESEASSTVEIIDP